MGRGELCLVQACPGELPGRGQGSPGAGAGWWGAARHGLRDGIFPQGEAHVSGNGRAGRG